MSVRALGFLAVGLLRSSPSSSRPRLCRRATERRAKLVAVGLVMWTMFAEAQAPSVPPGSSVPGPPGPRPQMPARDAAQIPTGTARIRGRVVAADGTPLRRANVRVSAGEIRVNRGATTDADGRYEVSDLPAGRYSISVSRNGYVSLQFGQQRPFEPGIDSIVADIRA